MKASDRTLARRYAKALLEAADSPEARARVAPDIGHALRLLREHEVRLRHPMVPAAEKARLLEAAFGRQVSDATRRFVELLLKKKRFGLLALVAKEVESLADEGAGIRRALVRSAAPLGEEEKGRLARTLEGFLGGRVIVDVKEDPALIGGLVVRAGDWVLDASLKRHLERLKSRFLAG